MGYTTDFIGHIGIEPPLNAEEQAYLMAFASSRRYRRPGGPYDVPRNPAAERTRPVTDLGEYNDIAPGQPSLWCGWQPCWEGCCLAHDGVEKSYGATEWLTYLIEHFLGRHAFAQRSGLDWFTEFTFDHTLSGVVAACRRDTRELYLIRVERNLVREEALVPADARYGDADPLPYEIEIDRQRSRRRRPGTP